MTLTISFVKTIGFISKSIVWNKDQGHTWIFYQLSIIKSYCFVLPFWDSSLFTCRLICRTKTDKEQLLDTDIKLWIWQHNIKHEQFSFLLSNQWYITIIDSIMSSFWHKFFYNWFGITFSRRECFSVKSTYLPIYRSS